MKTRVETLILVPIDLSNKETVEQGITYLVKIGGKYYAGGIDTRHGLAFSNGHVWLRLSDVEGIWEIKAV